MPRAAQTAKHSGGNFVILSFFTASGTGQLAVTDSTMNSTSNQTVLEDNVRTTVLKLKLNWTLQKEKNGGSNRMAVVMKFSHSV